jgi:hypothetical protein
MPGVHMRNMHGVLMSFRCISELEKVTKRKESPLIDQPVQFMSCVDQFMQMEGTFMQQHVQCIPMKLSNQSWFSQSDYPSFWVAGIVHVSCII